MSILPLAKREEVGYNGIKVESCGALWVKHTPKVTRTDVLWGKMFLGEFEHTIDEKGRITIPAKWRGRFATGVVVTKGIDSCLWLFPQDAFKSLSDKVSSLPLTDTRARDFRRQMFSGASDMEPDKQGRINLPNYLREYAEIDKQAIITGLNNYCEIWNPETWRQRQQDNHSDPEERAVYYESLGI